MKSIRVALLLFFLFFTGCASVKIVPEQTPGGVVNLKDNSQTIVKDNLVVTISPDEADLVNYNLEGMVASFNVEIQNIGEKEAVFDKDSFVLVDSDQRQYYALTPEKIKEMMAKDTYYLLPYPYVGFYYLEDYELAQFRNSTNSNLPYYFELRPQDIYSRALPLEPIIPKAKTRGLIYFHVDLNSLSAFNLNLYKKGTSKSAQPDFKFPYKVIK